MSAPLPYIQAAYEVDVMRERFEYLMQNAGEPGFYKLRTLLLDLFDGEKNAKAAS